MTVAIILGMWFACSLIAAPLIGWFLFVLSKDQTRAFRPLQKTKPRQSLGKGANFPASHHQHGDTVQPHVRRAARGR